MLERKELIERLTQLEIEEKAYKRLLDCSYYDYDKRTYYFNLLKKTQKEIPKVKFRLRVIKEKEKKEKEMIKIEIPISPVTKKNHGQIVMIKGRPIMLPSKPYQEYEKKCKPYIPKMEKPINFPINLKCTYYLETRRKTDLTNLLQATCDILVKYGVLEDDNYSIIASIDGSRACYDKENPRTVIEIERLKENEI